MAAAGASRRARRRGAPDQAQLTLFDLFAALEPAAEPAPRRTVSPSLAERLDPLLGGRLRRLVLTENRSRILSSRSTDDGGLEVRLHRCFDGAPEEVVARLADFLVGRGRRQRRDALAAIRRHFDSHAPGDEERPRPTLVRPRGAVHDLAEIRDELGRRSFDPAPQVAITWGRSPVRRRRRGGRRTILLGSYDAASNLIRVHPRLDRADVPRYVVSAVVHHEMLHAAMPAEVRGGRRILHPPELRRRERELEEHAAAEAWLAAHLPKLLRC